MKVKYIEELVGKYYAISEGDNVSSILTSKTSDDIATGMPAEVAKTIALDRNNLVDALVFAINKHGDSAYDVFSEIREKIYKK